MTRTDKPSNKRKAVWLAAGVASAVALAAALAKLPSEKVSRGAEAAQKISTAQDLAKKQRPRRAGALGDVPNWQQGLTTTFDFSQSASITQSGGELMLSFSLVGPLDVTKVSDKQLRFAFSGKVASLLGGGQTTVGDEAREKLEQEFKQPFVVTLPLNVKAEMRGAPGVSSFTFQSWKNLVANLEFTTNENGERAWKASEESSLGTCDFDYEINGNDGVTKRTSKCVHLTGPAKDTTYSSVAAERSFKFGENGRLETLSSSEDMTTEALPVAPAFRARTELSLVRRSEHGETPEQLTAWALQAEQESVDSKEAVEEQRDLEWDRARLGNRQFAGIMAKMFELHAKLDQKSAREKYEREYVALVASLRLEPTQHLPAIQKHIAAEGPLKTALIAALQDAGTEVGHETMANLLRVQKLSRDTRLELTRGLALTSRPSPTSVAALRDLKSDPLLGESATYGLGSSAYKTKESNPELSKAVTKDLVDDLDNTDDAEVHLTRLIALGNAGADSALDSIQRQMTSPIDNIRAAAAQALRRIQSDKADELLAVLATDTSPEVRSSAVEAFSERAPSNVGIRAISAVCVGDGVVRVRAMAVQLAARWISQAPALSAVLDSVASNDASDDLRLIARNALSKGTAG